MADTGSETHHTANPTSARAAEKTDRVRYILGISFILAIVALGVILIAFAQNR
jgi:hypothetical protein